MDEKQFDRIETWLALIARELELARVDREDVIPKINPPDAVRTMHMEIINDLKAKLTP